MEDFELVRAGGEPGIGVLTEEPPPNGYEVASSQVEEVGENKALSKVAILAVWGVGAGEIQSWDRELAESLFRVDRKICRCAVVTMMVRSKWLVDDKGVVLVRKIKAQ